MHRDLRQRSPTLRLAGREESKRDRDEGLQVTRGRHLLQHNVTPVTQNFGGRERTENGWELLTYIFGFPKISNTTITGFQWIFKDFQWISDRFAMNSRQILCESKCVTFMH